MSKNFIRKRRRGVGLFACFLGCALVTTIAAIIVERNLLVRLHQFALTWQLKLHVLDVESALYPHTLIVSLDGENLACHVVDALMMIEVFGTKSTGR